jgi:MoxR-like ATPase
VTSTLPSQGHVAPAGSDPGETSLLLERALFEAKSVVVGQDHLLERILVAVLARGHCLLEGVPGVAKTLAARTVATVIGGEFRRVQFTPDLVPADIIGTRIYKPSSESFDVELGPVMANLVLADEINRAPAKVQSALLEAMAERQVTIGTHTYALPDPFCVLATMNPIEHDGTYPLPEAQRDRFLLKIVVPLPEEREERSILRRMSVQPPSARSLLNPADVRWLQDQADQVFVHDAVADYAVRLVMTTRSPQTYGVGEIAPMVALGASPRATLGLVASARALALLRGRAYVLPHDVSDLAEEVIAHRLLLTFDALADGIAPGTVVKRVIERTPVPHVAPQQDVDHA